MFEQIKAYYDNGLWSEERVRLVTEKGIITKDQYYKITGQYYSDYSLPFNSFKN